MSLVDDVRNVIQGEVDDSPDTLEKFSRDMSLFKVRPAVVVHPRGTTDVEALVRFVSERKKTDQNISITTRAAGTDRSGAALGESVILNTVTHMNKILEVGDGYAVAESGTYFRDLDAATRKKNLEMPGYPMSRNIAAVGGMVANDAGGEKNLKYGKTSRYVEELEVVLSDGKVHTLKPCQGEPLTQKLAEQSFEGELYRKIARLVKDNREVIEKAQPDVTKNSSGYALWDIGDGTTSLNLARLFGGSQGTLGIITKIRFGLVKQKPFASMVVLFLNDFHQLTTIVPEVLKSNPDSFESYDEHTFTLALRYFPELALQMKTGIIELGFALIPELWMVLSGGVPKMVLLVEFRSDSQEEALRKTQELVAVLKRSGVRMRIAQDEKAAQKFWTIRRESAKLLRRQVRGKMAAPFIEDIVVHPNRLPEFLPQLNEILSRSGFAYTIAGHVGDGNLHILPLIDPKQPNIKKLMDKLAHEVYGLVLSYRGSISGEHSDGYIRTPYLEKMFGPEMVGLFREVKQAFDPSGIFNPGKKVGITFAEAQKHFDLPK